MKIAVAIWKCDVKDAVLNRCLRSLVMQTRKPNEVIIVKQTEPGDVQFSRMNNIAIKKTKCDYLMCCAADLIFSKNTFEAIEKQLKKNPKALILTARVDVDSETKKSWKGAPNNGGPNCITLPVKWLKEVGGYDERYTGWGYFDSDMVERAKMGGFEEVWMHEFHKDQGRWIFPNEPVKPFITVLHIRHPTRKSKNDKVIKRNEALLRGPKTLIANKGKKWGVPWKK